MERAALRSESGAGNRAGATGEGVISQMINRNTFTRRIHILTQTGVLPCTLKEIKMQQDLFVKMALDAWNTELSRTDALFNGLKDDELTREIAPGKNTGAYLLGHLVGVHDKMLPLLGTRPSLYPDLYEKFVSSPYKKDADYPKVGELRKYWNEVSKALADFFSSTTPAQWFEKHNSVSEEDFKKEPHRNKLNVLISRTMHLSYHRGQLILLKAKNSE
jgi:uncharacterized damage-inducible protein DinB